MKGNLAKSAEGKVKLVDVQNCYSCHKDIKEFHQGNKHASVNCAYCHTNSDEHAKDGVSLDELFSMKPEIFSKVLLMK